MKVRHGLMLLWFIDLMNVTEKLQFVSTLISSAFVRADLIAVTEVLLYAH